MDEYEADIARQPRGPFTKVAERQLIRRTAEHWRDRQRYTSERNRRFALYAKWIGIGFPILLGAIKVVEAFAGKAN